LRSKLPDGKRRHEFQANHGFRKFFKTACETAGVKPIVTETLMGHSTGISDSYYRPTQNELLDDYLKAVPFLTITNEAALKTQLEVLQANVITKEALESALREKTGIIDMLKETLADVSDRLTKVERLQNTQQNFTRTV
jgi:hypothetical protein